MKQTLECALTDIEKVLLEKLPQDQPVAFSVEVPLDMRGKVQGNLFQRKCVPDTSMGEDDTTCDFWVAEIVVEDTYRVGPTEIAPTRHEGIIYLNYYHLGRRIHLPRHPALIAAAESIAERTLRGIRFRPFFPYVASVESGYTRFSGGIEFEFELYRGDRNGY